MAKLLRALHRALARLVLPPAFFHEYGPEILATTADRVDGAGDPLRAVGIAAGEILDLLRTAFGEWVLLGASSMVWVKRGALLDLRAATRSLTRTPQSSLVAVATIAVAIGAGTAVFSVADGVLLRPLAYPSPDRIVRVAVGARPESGTTEGPFSPSGYWHLVRETRAFESVGAAGVVPRALTDGEPATAVEVGLMTRSAFDVIGVDPILGRLPSVEEDRPEGRPVALISHALWQDRYGGDPEVLGSVIGLGPTRYEIVGVMPARYAFPTPGTDAWVARRLDPSTDNFRAHFLTVFARLAPDVTLEAAARDTERVIAGFPDLGYGPEWFEGIFTGRAVVRRLKDQVIGPARGPIVTVGAMVAVLCLIAFINVASLVLVRAERRRDERALRGALGAGRGHLARYALIESGILAGAGTVLGIALAGVGTRAVLLTAPAAIPRQEEIGIDATALVFASACAVLGLLVFGLLPHALPAGIGRVGSARHPRSAARRRAGRRVGEGLTMGQLGLAATLLAASVVLLRTSAEQRAIDPGFVSDAVLTFRLTPSATKYPNPDASARFYDELLGQMHDVPGVRAVGAITTLPLTGGGGVRDATIEGVETPEGEFGTQFHVRRATPGYFDAMSIPIVEGRAFTSADHDERLGSAVISASIKRAFWPDESALGKRIETLGAPATVVGVVGDIRESDLNADPPFVFYKPLLDSVGGGGLAQTVVVRTANDPSDLVAPLRQVVAELDPELPLAHVRLLDEVVGDALSRTRFATTLTTIAAGIALFLALIGTYGVLSYSVLQRRTEMAVRAAVGAEAHQIAGLVLAQGLRLAAAGLTIGSLGAVLATAALRTAFEEVGPMGPGTVGAVCGVILFAVTAGSLVPAARVSRTPPELALRDDA